MRVLQLIDSLEAGGAERMAISLANELDNYGVASFLCVTRKEGPLKSDIQTGVGYTFVRKRSALDVLALIRANKFLSKNKIDTIHAHSSSFFFVYLLKLIKPRIDLIWHDHYGNSELLHDRKFKILRFCSKKFKAIISVNELLKNWAEQNLKCKEVYFLNNFVSLLSQEQPVISVKGGDELKIASLANFRPQKDHLTLLKAFKICKDKGQDCSLHLFGKINKDDYYDELKEYIATHQIENVYFYGTQTGIIGLLKKCDIGVLSSISEGLPVALLEYGIAGLPVVSTNVGQTAEVILDFGKIVPAKNKKLLSDAILFYLENTGARLEDATHYSKHIRSQYSFKKIVSTLLAIYKT